MEAHIVKSYDDEINQLNTQISAMGASCEWQLAKALKALENMDVRLAEEVIKEDVNLNALYKELEENAVMLLAKRTPLAADLRYILAAMRTGSELERIGDYAANIARRVTELGGCELTLEAPIALIQEIGVLARRMITDVVDAFLKQNVESALEIWHRDDVIDRKFARLMTDLRASMNEDTSVVDCGTLLIFMGRCLERIGDHITNIAEGIYYIETGETYIGTLET
ncbi:MAG TPA: phosphate transport system regulatory protein PhoU [Desulfobacteraceae bacterium]|nr:phosphate transport system regulatory protein PhoU [Desulfobacteraceae bacterium]